jgi:predicted CopG family antitoxin
MEAKEKSFDDIIKELCLKDEIKISDIPKIDLYVEQVIGFIEDNMGHVKRNENDKLITKTMVGNYTRDGVLMPSKNKKYSKNHIIMLILIYNLKQILSIEDIKALFSPIMKDINTTSDDIIPLEDVYSTLLDIKSNEFECFGDVFNEKFKLVQERLEHVEGQNKDLAEIFLTIITLIAQANAHKRLAEKLIDKYFKG